LSLNVINCFQLCFNVAFNFSLRSYMKELLNAEGISAAAFHGGRSQGEREAALGDYKVGAP
jgi:superfamily II DNA/RNA helicase